MPSGAAASISASSFTLRSRSSGALSCTKSASASAFSSSGSTRRRDRSAPVGESELGQRRPRGIDEVLQAFRGVGRRVPGNDVVALGEEVRRPTSPDDTGPDAAHRADVGHRNGGSGLGWGHADLGFRARISRPSSGVATSAPIDSTMVRARSTSCALVALTPLLR